MRPKVEPEFRPLDPTTLTLLDKSRETGDVFINIQDRKFRAHREVLMSCGYFRNMLRNRPPTRTPLEILNVSAVRLLFCYFCHRSVNSSFSLKCAFAVVLDFLYGRKGLFDDLPEEILLESVELAAMLKVDHLKEHFKQYIEREKFNDHGRCYALALKIAPEVAQELVKRISSYFKPNIDGTTQFNFRNVTLSLALETLKSHNQSLKAVFYDNREKLAEVKRQLNFITEWEFSHRETETAREEIQCLMGLVPLGDVSRMDIEAIIGSSEFCQKRIYLPLRVAYFNLWNMSVLMDPWFRIQPAIMSSLNFRIWLVEYKNVVVVKEYDFQITSYKRTETVMFKACLQHFAVTRQFLYVFHSTGMYSFYTENRTYANNHDFPRDMLNLNMLHVHGRQNEVYVLGRSITELCIYSVCCFLEENSSWIRFDFNVNADAVEDWPSSYPVRHMIISAKSGVYAVIGKKSFKLTIEENGSLKSNLVELPMLGEKLLKIPEVLIQVRSYESELDALRLPSTHLYYDSFLKQFSQMSLRSVCACATGTILAVRCQNHPKEIQILFLGKDIDSVSDRNECKLQSLGFLPLELMDPNSLIGVVLTAETG